MQVHHLYAVAPGVTEVATKVRLQFQSVLAENFFPHFGDLRLVANQDAEVALPVRLKPIAKSTRSCGVIIMTANGTSPKEI